MLSISSRFARALCLLCATSLPVTALAQTYPKTLLDDQGNAITLAQKPQSISSKLLFTDEVLVDLVEPERISSLTNLAVDPVFSNIVDKVDPSLQLLDLNVERIIVNQPDIVFVADWTDQGKVQQLRDAGVPVFLLSTPTTFEGIQQKIQQLGDIVGEPERARDITTQMDSKLTQSLVVPRTKLIALDYSSWGVSSTKSSTWHGILTRAHLTNAVADHSADQFGQVPMSKELVVQLDPQVLFLPGWIYGEENAASNFENQVLSDPAFRSVDALKNHRVYLMPENLRGTYSQYIADAIVYVNQAVYQ